MYEKDPFYTHVIHSICLFSSPSSFYILPISVFKSYVPELNLFISFYFFIPVSTHIGIYQYFVDIYDFSCFLKKAALIFDFYKADSFYTIKQLASALIFIKRHFRSLQRLPMQIVKHVFNQNIFQCQILFDCQNQLMMKQEISEACDSLPQDELKVRAQTQIDPNPEREDMKIQLTKLPIFRIDVDHFNLEYKINGPESQVHSRLLNNTTIRPQDREKLKSWMLSETQHLYDRQTYALASKYLDMFFSLGHKVQRKAFQILGISCLILAAKVNERRVPSISFEVFDREQIFNFQKGLLKILNYRVTPLTYVPLCHLILCFWDNYRCQRHCFNNLKYFQEGVISIKRVRSIFQTLECLDLVHKTLDIKLEILVFCVFFIENRKNCLLMWAKKQEMRKSIQTETEHEFATIYQQLMSNFLKVLKTQIPAFSSAQLPQKLLCYIMNFARIAPKIKVAATYKHFIFEITRQTYNPEISELAQHYLQRQNHH